MNINLTTKCNNHCPYCFQEGVIKREKELTLEEYKEIIEWGKEEFIQKDGGLILLGGEPTLYPHMIEAIEYYFLKYPTQKVQVITNMLGLKNNIDYICNNKQIRFLINSTYDEDKKEIFYKNLAKIKYPEYATISVTLSPSKELNKKYILRLKEITNNYPQFKKLRLGLATPVPNKSLKDIYNYDKDIKFLFDTLKNTSLNHINFDCAINFCQISPEFYFNMFKYEGIKVFGVRINTCEGPINDILPDFSSKYCSSSGETFWIKDVRDFKNSLEVVNFYKNIVKKYKIKNKKCKKCKLLGNLCHPCHSFDQALLRFEKESKSSK